MSYCRWSNDDFQCDAYVYEATEGVVIHLAGRRRRYLADLPEPVPFTRETADAWMQRFNKICEMQEGRDFEFEPITLPHAGESWYGLSFEEAADQLERLKALGYLIPDYVVSELREEAEGA